jgi:hypothetical protein
LAQDDENKKGSDLSDLKARLGLDKEQEGDDESPPSSERSRGTEESDSSVPAGTPEGPPASGPPASTGPETSKGPPSAPSRGPSGGPPSPPGAESVDAPGSGAEGPDDSASTAEPTADADEAEADFDWDDDEGFDALDVSTPVWIGAVVVLLVGFLAGYLYSTSSHQRSLYRAQTNQAQAIAEALNPRVEAYQEVRSIIQSLDPQSVQFDKTKALADAIMAVDSSLLGPSDRLLIGGRRTSMLTTFMVNMQRLNDLINQHRRITLDEERSRLEELMDATNADASGDDAEEGGDSGPQYAMLFDFEYLKQRGNSKTFRHRNGVLGTVANLDDPDNGQVTFRPRSSGDPREVPVQWIVPLTRSELLSVKGETAFQRYSDRVAELKYQIEQMGSSPSTLRGKINELAERPSPPLIQL